VLLDVVSQATAARLITKFARQSFGLTTPLIQNCKTIKLRVQTAK